MRFIPYLGDSVGGGAIGDGGRTGAVSLVRGDDLGGIADGVVGSNRIARVVGGNAGNENGSNGSELHFD